MNWLFLNKYINFTLLTIFGHLQPSSPAAFSSADQISLYDATDKITILTSQNFSSTVYQSNTAWLIEFYASWCGHCRSYTNIYREIAIDVWTWKRIVRIGAINCYGGDNQAFCRQHGIRGYPSLQLIPPDAKFDNQSKAVPIPATDAINVEKELIKGLESLTVKSRSWPRFIPLNRVTFEELFTHIPKTIKLVLIIIEKRDDLIGRQIILDFSKYYEQLTIFRTTVDGKFWRKLHVNITNIPALIVIHRNHTVARLDIKQNSSENVDYRNVFSSTIRSYINRTKSIDNFNDQDFEEIIESKNALKTTRTRQQSIKYRNITDDSQDKNTKHKKVNMIDLEIALSYMFRQEIPQMKDIHGETYHALVQWLTILTKYFPGREPVMAYLRQVLLKISEQSNGFSGDRFQEIIDIKTSDAYLPNDHQQYQHCAGSEPQYRGYPCALWLLFHTLTVSQYKADSSTINVTEIPFAIKNYIKYFFACRQCSENFMKETSNINQLNLTNKYEAIVYLWTIHNHVNQRLAGDVTEDPKHPKVQFPSKYLCTTCHLTNKNEYDNSKTIDFLLQYYSKENIETSSLLLSLKKSQYNENLSNQSASIISKLDYNNENDENKESLGFLRRFLHRFSLYIFIAFIILVILFHRRYSRRKTKRHTI